MAGAGSVTPARAAQVRGSRKVAELWWSGLPPSVRGRVWKLAIGNELNITTQLYRVYHDE